MDDSSEPAERRIVELEQEVADLKKSKRRFPIMSEGTRAEGYRAHPPIPWAVAERAYATYTAQYGDDQTLERMAERGGFGCFEMDQFAPGWEEECTAVAELELRLKDAQKVIAHGGPENARLITEVGELELENAKLKVHPIGVRKQRIDDLEQRLVAEIGKSSYEKICNLAHEYHAEQMIDGLSDDLHISETRVADLVASERQLRKYIVDYQQKIRELEAKN